MVGIRFKLETSNRKSCSLNGRVKMNKYKAKKISGKVNQEHRLVMEKHLGRRLTKEEVVHHVDRDKSNNDINNLILFPTKKAHTKFHYQQGDLKLSVGENKKKLINGKLKCNHCKKLKELKEFVTSKKDYLGIRGTCKECYKIQRKKYEYSK